LAFTSSSRLLLVLAALFTVVGMVAPLIEGSRSRDVGDAGVFILDRILLLFIIAELLYTLRLVIFSGGRILVEPFLFIGLIAVVRRVLVITAGLEGGRGDVTDFLIEICALAGLALVLAVSIHLLRRSAVPQE
jgi:phosphate-starvation-inducible protein E